MSRPRWIVALAVSSAFVLAGCGGSDDEETVSALAEDLQSEDDLGELDLTGDEARCTAEDVVDDLGADRVQEAGLVGADEEDFADLDDEEIESIAEALGDCVEDIDAQLSSAVQDGILEESDTMPIEEDEAACVADGVVDALGVDRLLVIGAGASGGDPFVAGAVSEEEADAIAEGFFACVDIRQVFLEQFRAEGVPDETAECLASEIDEDEMRVLFSSEFTGEDVDPTSLLGSALEACGL